MTRNLFFGLVALVLVLTFKWLTILFFAGVILSLIYGIYRMERENSFDASRDR